MVDLYCILFLTLFLKILIGTSISESIQRDIQRLIDINNSIKPIIKTLQSNSIQLIKEGNRNEILKISNQQIKQVN